MLILIMVGKAFLIGLIFILPQLQFKYPNLLDISETVSNKSNGFINTLSYSFHSQARFRPIYDLSRYVYSTLFGLNARLYFITFGLILGLTLFVDWLVTDPKKENPWLILILVLLLISPITIDTYWRLGVAENLFTLFLLSSVYFALKNKGFALIASLIFTMASKETAIFFIPCFILFLFWKKEYLWTTVLAGFLAIYLPFLVPRLINTSSDSYTQLFKIDLARNALTMSTYFHSFPAFFLLLLAATLGYTYTKVKKTCQPEDTFLFLLSWTSLLPVAFFNNVQAYYLFPSLNLIVLFCLRLTGKRAKPRLLFFISFLVIFISLPSVIKMAKYWASGYAGDAALISFLRNYHPSNDFRYFAEGRMEYVNSIHLLLSDFDKKKISFSAKIDEFQGIPNTKSILFTENSNYAGKILPLCYKPLFSNIERCKWFIVEK